MQKGKGAVRRGLVEEYCKIRREGGSKRKEDGQERQW